MNARETPVAPRVGGFLDTAKAVGAAFVGLRRRSDLERDSRTLNPVHLIVMAFLAVGVFVGALMGLVNWVVGH